MKQALWLCHIFLLFQTQKQQDFLSFGQKKLTHVFTPY